MTESPFGVISILNWNGWRDTLKCLESVRRLDYPNYLTVVVDNCSWNDSVERIRAWAKEALPDQGAFVEYTRETALGGGNPSSEAQLDAAESPNRLVLIRNEENLGFTGGNNVAIHYSLHRNAAAHHVLLLNNDATVESDCLTCLVSVARSTDAGVVGAAVLEEGTKRILFCGRAPLVRQFFSPFLKWQLPPPEPNPGYWNASVVMGSAMLISTRSLEDVNAYSAHYLDDRLFMYMEEHAFCFEASKLGHETFLAAQAVAYHKRGRSSGGGKGPLRCYYGNRNRVLLANRMLPLVSKVLFHLANVSYVFAQSITHAVRHRRASARAVLQGVLDGYRGVGGKWKYHDQMASWTDDQIASLSS
jgi:GT2 family glycosyltransferase